MRPYHGSRGRQRPLAGVHHSLTSFSGLGVLEHDRILSARLDRAHLNSPDPLTEFPHLLGLDPPIRTGLPPMLTTHKPSIGEEPQGWSVWAIARHLARDRKTIRAYLTGEQMPRVHHSTRGDPG
jgi:hypothetical protein